MATIIINPTNPTKAKNNADATQIARLTMAILLSAILMCPSNYMKFFRLTKVTAREGQSMAKNTQVCRHLSGINNLNPVPVYIA